MKKVIASFLAILMFSLFGGATTNNVNAALIQNPEIGPGWYDAVKKGTLETFSTANGRLNVRGWTITNEPITRHYSYLFAMDATTNKEIMRWKIDRTARPDVQKAYPNIPNSLNSGFNLNVNVPQKLWGKSFKLKVRYTSDLSGNYNTSDHDFGNVLNMPVQSSKGCIDTFKQDGSNLFVRGWNIGMFTQDLPYRYIFVMDSATNRELTRVRINNDIRNDVASYYGNYSNAAQSGFSLYIPVTDKLKGKKVFIVSRYTADPAGNGSLVNDVWFGNNQLTVK